MKQKNYSLHPELLSCFVQILVRWQELGVKKEQEEVEGGVGSVRLLKIWVPLLIDTSAE